MILTRVVADAGPLIAFAGIQRLDLIQRLYGEIAVPPEVAAEVRPSIPDIPSWIVVKSFPKASTRQLHPNLDAGERAAIELAIVLGAKLLLIDDRKGRDAAIGLGLEIAGSVGVAIAAKRLRLIAAARPIIDELRASGLFLSDRIYAAVLVSLDERTNRTRAGGRLHAPSAVLVRRSSPTIDARPPHHPDHRYGTPRSRSRTCSAPAPPGNPGRTPADRLARNGTW